MNKLALSRWAVIRYTTGMHITRETVEQLGHLARLDLHEDEVHQLVEQLPKIVDYVSQLQSIDAPVLVTEESPTAGLRHDQAMPSDLQSTVLAQAPEREGDLWKVDAVFS